jgi:hypothetical protein
LLILANCRHLRSARVMTVAFILAIILAGLGLKLILELPEESNSALFFPIFTPLTALVLFQLTRILYKKKKKKEIILYIRGLFPVRQSERYVTRQEINITFIILLLSVIIPYIILILAL